MWISASLVDGWGREISGDAAHLWVAVKCPAALSPKAARDTAGPPPDEETDPPQETVTDLPREKGTDPPQEEWTGPPRGRELGPPRDGGKGVGGGGEGVGGGGEGVGGGGEGVGDGGQGVGGGWVGECVEREGEAEALGVRRYLLLLLYYSRA